MSNIIKSFKTILLVVLLIFNAAFLNAQESKTLSFVVGTHASSNITTDVYFRFLEKVYAELGYQLTLKTMPMKRAYKGVDSGIADGMVILSENILKIYKNIIIVPIPLTTIDVIAITTRGKQFKIDGPDSLKPYRIGIIRGYSVAEKLTRNINRQIVNNHHSLLSIVEIGRVDVGLAMKRETLRFLAKNPQYDNIRLLEPPFISIKLYSALNKKHAALGEQVAPITQQLLSQGVLEKLYEPYRVQPLD